MASQCVLIGISGGMVGLTAVARMTVADDRRTQKFIAEVGVYAGPRVLALWA